MLTTFLSYARADGSQAAIRLRAELEAMGFDVWRDVEDMQGGLAWKEQLRDALRQVDAVLVLLTPESTASRTVEWEWETALTLGKRVIGLLIAPCKVPPELARLHYHDLSDPAGYTLGLAKLARDLLPLAAARPLSSGPPASTSGSKYQVIAPVNSAVGDDAIAINQTDSGTPDPAAIAKLVAALRRQAPDDPAVQAEIAAMLRET